MTTTLRHTSIEQALTAGLRWLYHTEQPEQALVERCGVRITVPARSLRFLPIGDGGAPLVIVDADLPRWTPTCRSAGPCTLPEAELTALADELTKRGLPPASWHYHGSTGTVVLSLPAHPTLRAAVDRYSHGCPWHHTLVCDAPVSVGGQACPWHINGHNAAAWPSTTSVARDYGLQARRSA